MKAYFDDEDYGRVNVHLRRGAKSISVKWKEGSLLVTAPLGLSYDQIMESFQRLKPKISNLKEPDVKFFDGQEIECFQCKVIISCDARLKNSISYGANDDGSLYIHVPVTIDFNSQQAKIVISKVLKNLMKNRAQYLLIPYAEDLAQQLKVACNKITIGSGMRKLGHCTTKNDIQLSSNIMFLPEQLVAYIICHELAHVTHHDHSPAFHQLVNQYVSGKEKELEKQLKQFQWPILR